MSVENIAIWLGYTVMVAGGTALVAALVYWAALLSNLAQKAALESYGGWQVFFEYRDWYQERKHEARRAAATTNERTTK